MIRLFAFISILSLFTELGSSPETTCRDGNDSLNLIYQQFLLQAIHVSGEPIAISSLDADILVLMDYGHCSQCAKEVLEFMANVVKSGFKVAMIHYGGQESYGTNRSTRNKYKFEYAYLQEVYFSPVSLPDKSKLPVVALPKSGKFIEYNDFIKEKELLMQHRDMH